jgi:hypothetical protein
MQATPFGQDSIGLDSVSAWGSRERQNACGAVPRHGAHDWRAPLLGSCAWGWANAWPVLGVASQINLRIFSNAVYFTVRPGLGWVVQAGLDEKQAWRAVLGVPCGRQPERLSERCEPVFRPAVL